MQSLRSCLVLAFAGAAIGANANILINPGFETGTLTGWTTNGFSVTNADFHSGAFSVTSNANVFLEQDFSAIPVSQVTEISLWVKQPSLQGSTFFNAVDLLYSDNTSGEFIPGGNDTGAWFHQDVTADLAPGKSLVGIRAWGFSSGVTQYDDFVVNVSVPEPASLAAIGVGLAVMIRRRTKRS